MKRIGLTACALILFGGLALAHQDLQQKAQAIKEAAARNAQALRSYSWITKTELSVKGEVKNTKIESCKYGPDGKVQKTELTDPPPPPKKQRGLRGRIVAKKTKEMKEEMQAAAALVHSYVPPAPEKLQAVIGAGKLSITPVAGTAALRFADYLKADDSMTITLDAASKSMHQIAVDTWLEEPDNKVTLQVNFQSLPDGTSFVAETVLMIPEDEIEVRIENSNYQKVVP
jgi:hypothetical protein